MTTEHDKNKTQYEQGRANPTGSVNPADKTKDNPGHEGAQDPKNPQDIAKKTPSRGYDSPETEEEESGQNEKRRAS
jgi:hypothetical protein